MTKAYPHIRTARDIGAAIRERRRQLKLDQAELARRIGTSRQWVVGLEKGRPRAEMALVLRALDALGLRLSASVVKPARKEAVDLDSIVAAARTRPK
jgi:HTH-type transcriptional regulator/antitoxin HipB